MEQIQTDMQNRIREYIASHPGCETELADAIRVSRPTITRWVEGKNLPHPIVAEGVITYLKNLNTEPDPPG